ncbi:MAG: glutathione S-transferase [Burkholderiaceae bacterium]
MLKLWGRTSSINVRKALWAVQEAGVAFERIDAGHEFGIVTTPQFMAKNPNAKIPVIEDGGFVLWESNVIVRWVCAQYARGTLYPADARELFDAERWMDWQQTTLNPAGRQAFVQWIRTKEAERKPALIADSTAQTEPLMALLDAHLGTRAYMAGESFTMADIPIACEIHRWWGLPQERPPRPNIERWYSAILARPATRGVLDLPLS